MHALWLKVAASVEAGCWDHVQPAFAVGTHKQEKEVSSHLCSVAFPPGKASNYVSLAVNYYVACRSLSLQQIIKYIIILWHKDRKTRGKEVFPWLHITEKCQGEEFCILLYIVSYTGF